MEQSMQSTQPQSVQEAGHQEADLSCPVTWRSNHGAVVKTPLPEQPLTMIAPGTGVVLRRAAGQAGGKGDGAREWIDS